MWYFPIFDVVWMQWKCLGGRGFGALQGCRSVGRAGGFPSVSLLQKMPIAQAWGRFFWKESLKRLLSPGDWLVRLAGDPGRAVEESLRGRFLFGELFHPASHLDVKRGNTRYSWESDEWKSMGIWKLSWINIDSPFPSCFDQTLWSHLTSLYFRNDFILLFLGDLSELD